MKYSSLILILLILCFKTYAGVCVDELTETKTEETSRTQNFVNKILNHVRCVGQSGMNAHTHKRIAIGVAKNLSKKTEEKSVQKKFQISDPTNYFQDSEKVSFSRSVDGDVFILNETKDGNRELVAFLCERHHVNYEQLQAIEVFKLEKPKRAKDCRYKQFLGEVSLKFEVDDATISLPKNGALHLIDKIGDNGYTYKVDSLCYDPNASMTNEPCLMYFLTIDPMKKAEYQIQCELSKKNK